MPPQVLPVFARLLPTLNDRRPADPGSDLARSARSRRAQVTRSHASAWAGRSIISLLRGLPRLPCMSRFAALRPGATRRKTSHARTRGGRARGVRARAPAWVIGGALLVALTGAPLALAAGPAWPPDGGAPPAALGAAAHEAGASRDDAPSDPASGPVEIEFWHSMQGALGEHIAALAHGFNATQPRWRVVPVYKGSYPASMTAALAAQSAGRAPHLVQVLDVGTATMMAAREAIVPLHQLMRQAGIAFSAQAYLDTISRYYSDAQGRLLSLPFNASTALLYVNRAAFRRAGLEPDQAPATWSAFVEVAKRLQAAGQRCVYTTAWPSWVHIETFSAWHDLPVSTHDNGFAGDQATLVFNGPEHVAHLAMLRDFALRGWFTYAGRRNEAEARFTNGECAMLTSSSAARANIARQAELDYSAHRLPYHAAMKGAPQRTLLGGASLWTLKGKPQADYIGVARFLAHLSEPSRQASWHQTTGYLPVTRAALALTQASGYYQQHPDAWLAIESLHLKPATPHSRGVRLGHFVQVREVIDEELNLALTGAKHPRQALDSAVRRGNLILERFRATSAR